MTRYHMLHLAIQIFTRNFEKKECLSKRNERKAFQLVMLCAE